MTSETKPAANDATEDGHRAPPEGWVLQNHMQTFSGHAGPIYFRKEGPTPGVGFYAASHHANLGGIVHGGMLLTLADMSLWDICARASGRFMGVTVTMNAEFLAPGRIGEFIEASGEMVKAGGTVLFARGLVTSNGTPLLSFSGTLKRRKPTT